MGKRSVGEIVISKQSTIEVAMDRSREATRSFRSTLERDHPELVAGFNDVIEAWATSRTVLIATLQEIVHDA